MLSRSEDYKKAKNISGTSTLLGDALTDALLKAPKADVELLAAVRDGVDEEIDRERVKKQRHMDRLEEKRRATQVVEEARTKKKGISLPLALALVDPDVLMRTLHCIDAMRADAEMLMEEEDYDEEHFLEG